MRSRGPVRPAPVPIPQAFATLVQALGDCPSLQTLDLSQNLLTMDCGKSAGGQLLEPSREVGPGVSRHGITVGRVATAPAPPRGAPAVSRPALATGIAAPTRRTTSATKQSAVPGLRTCTRGSGALKRGYV